MIGGNKSAEDDGADDAEDSGTTGVNIVIYHKLQEMQGYKKSDYKKHIKNYIKKVVEHLQTQKKTEAEVETFKADATKAVQKFLKEFDDLQLFRGEDLDVDVDEGGCMLAVLKYDDDGTPYMYFFKHGLLEEKVVCMFI